MPGAAPDAWPAADRYRYLDGAGPADLAWEWLRRDPDYRRIARDRAVPSASSVTIVEAAPADCTERWGCLNMPDADRPWADASVLWSAAVEPSVLKVIARPAANAERQVFDLGCCVLPIILVRGRSREHLLLCAGQDSVRLDVVSGTLQNGPVSLIFDFAAVDEIELAISALRRFLHFSRTCTSPRQPSLAGQRLRRQMLALRVHDAISAGASIRDVGIMLFGIDRVRDEWAGEALKSQCGRHIALAREMAAGGYLSSVDPHPENRINLFLRERRNEISRHRTNSLSKVPKRNRSWIAPSLLQPSDIRLRKTGRLGHLVLRQPPFLPKARKVSPDGFAHVHPLQVEELDAARYSL